jgi:hypothetical protein
VLVCASKWEARVVEPRCGDVEDTCRMVVLGMKDDGSELRES